MFRITDVHINYARHLQNVPDNGPVNEAIVQEAIQHNHMDPIQFDIEANRFATTGNCRFCQKECSIS